MGRPPKRKKNPKHMPRFVVPANETPVPTFGDVIMTMQASTWSPPRGRSPLRAAQRALAAALAACTRIGATEAVSITFKEALTGRLTLMTQDGQERPVFFLPAVVKLVENLEEFRPRNADPALFVSGCGTKLSRTELEHDMICLGRQWRFHGASLSTRLFEFFDDCFAGEEDRPAVAVLRRINLDLARPLRRKAVEQAALDEDRLRDVLEGHLLAGPAGRWIGARGVAAAEPTMRLFTRRRLIASGSSEALSTDPVCIVLAQTEWPRRGQRAMRKKLVGLHFDHLETLHLAGRLSNADMAFLFHTTVKWVWKKRVDRAIAELTDDQRAERARWLADLPTLYLARPQHEGFDDFYARTCDLAPPHVKFTLLFVAGILNRGGVL
jgi:hypothetical protein